MLFWNMVNAMKRHKTGKVEMVMYVYVGRIIAFNSALVSCDCCNKLSQIWWLKTTEMSSPTVLEARSLKLRYWQEHAFPRGYWGSCTPCPFPVTICIQMVASLQTLLFLLCLLFCIFSSSV